MSLQLIAKQMEAKGRKGDSMLVHMTPGEVEGLQKLAENAGGSLTVNPETGLVEANFLKRMLPTLVGIGVGMFAGPMAGAAAGAAVGGYQAKRNDEDVAMGALMGGLGGYGGAGIGAGLGAAGSTAAQAAAMNTAATAGQAANLGTAASVGSSALPSGFIGAGAENIAGEAVAQQAANAGLQQELKAQAINQASETAAKDFASQGFTDRASQGIQALAGKPGRDAFFGQVGMKTAGMAAAPMLIDDRKQAEAPTDDEMYAYDFDPGRTYAERNPSAGSSEDEYFNPTFSNRRKIRAKDYFNAAEGGEVADAAPADDGVAGGMSGASKAAFDYLMGNAASSAPEGGIAGLRATPQNEMLEAPSDQQYVFNPATGQFIKNKAYKSGLKNIFVNSTGKDYYRSNGGGDPVDSNPEWSGKTDAEKAAYYRENPTMAAITQFGQKALGYTKLGALQNYFNPGFTENQRAIAQGIDIGPTNLGRNYVGESETRGGNEGGYADNRGNGGEQYGDMPSGTYAEGGLMGLAKGGMKSGGFVVPADVVSMVGEGNTDAGYKRIKSMVPSAVAIKGKDGGQADTVKTHIEGKQPARVAHGEMYIPPETVKRMGGAKKLYAMMDRVREQATGSKKQIKPVSLKQAMA